MTDICKLCHDNVKNGTAFKKGYDSFDGLGYYLHNYLIADISYTNKRITFCKWGKNKRSIADRFNAITQAILGSLPDIFFRVVDGSLDMFFIDDEHCPCNYNTLYTFNDEHFATWEIELRERW